MTAWQHGYVTDTTYTHGFYRECAPAWLDWVALLHGAEPPAAGRRLLELGCGQGFGLCLLAAVHPDQPFVGVDFNPEHIAHARALARRAELKNIEFHAADFVALATAPDLPWGDCDYVVAHGILSWVSDPVRAAIFQVIDRCLNPGGLAYFSYNSLPGKLPAHPLRQLMWQFAQRQGVTEQALGNALALLQQFSDAKAGLFAALPGLTARVEQLREQARGTPNYLFHEYLNAAWPLFYCTDIVEQAGAARLRYLGSATLPENYDAFLPEPMRQLLAQAPDRAMRELYLDLLINQSFRRDVFARGAAPLWSGARLEQFDVRALTLTQPAADISLRFKTSFGEVTGRDEVYLPLIAALGKGTLRIGELRRALPDLTAANLLQSISLLVHGGALGFAPVETKPKTAWRFNQAVAEAIAQGAPYRFLALPGSGSGAALDEIQGCALDACLKGATTLEQLTAGVRARLRALGKSLLKDGQPIQDDAATSEELNRRLEPFLGATLPLWRRLGAVK